MCPVARAEERYSSARVGRGGGEDSCYFVARARACECVGSAGVESRSAESLVPVRANSVHPQTQMEANMVKLNKLFRPRTHEGARAVAFTPEQELKRALMIAEAWVGTTSTNNLRTP